MCVTFVTQFIVSSTIYLCNKLKYKLKMNKYLIKREIAGASKIPSEKLDEIGQGSESVLIAMRNEGKNIEQEHSYIAGNNVFCVYNAESEDMIKEHAERAGVPANEITLISSILEHNTSND
jgi:hypothetical protein